MNMIHWLDSLKGACGKRAFPIITYPAAQLMSEKSLKKIVTDSRLLADCVVKYAEQTPAAAVCTPMDLSIEAECFGADVRLFDDSVPAIGGALLSDLESVKSLTVPSVGSGRTAICIEAVKSVKRQLTDRPLFAGVIGPFSLAGRLSDITEIMYYCYDYPDELEALLNKCTEFIINYSAALKAAGADGILLCEPLAGMLSPSLEADFSAPFVKRIVDAVQDDEFLVIYHNCGNGVTAMADSLSRSGAAAYHFGNSVSLTEMLEKMPPDRVILGNIDPVGILKNGTPESIAAAVNTLCEECNGYPNFVLSTGCDAPPDTPWQNINAFFCKNN